MARFVALLRGSNVGRGKRVAMTDLRRLLESLGYGSVGTLLTSGNAVFDGAAKPQVRHARLIQAAVARDLGVDTLVIVKSATDSAAGVLLDRLGDAGTTRNWSTAMKLRVLLTSPA